MLPLMYVKSGDIVRISKLIGRDDGKKHLMDLGFVDGAVAKVVSSHNGDVILNIKESRIAITKEMAEKIMIEIIDKSKN